MFKVNNRNTRKKLTIKIPELTKELTIKTPGRGQ